MKDQAETTQELIQELTSLRQRIAELEQSEAMYKRVEEKLGESKEKYRNIIENIEDGYFEVDLAGNFTFFNPSLCRILGYPGEEMLGMNNRAFLDAENAKNVSRAFNEVYLTGIPQKGFEWETIRKDGARTSIEVSVSLIVKPGEEPAGFRGIARDITERKRVLKALQESEDLFRSLVDYMHDAMIILNWEGDILFANRAAARIIEYERPEELVGHNMVEYLHPDSLPKATADLEAVKAGKMGFLSEYHLYLLTGRHIWLESIGGKITFRNANANLACIRDITDRKRSVEALQMSEDNFRRSLDDSPMGARIVSEEGETIYANRAILDIYGYEGIGELQETSAKERYTSESYAEFLLRREKRRMGGADAPSEYEISIVRKDGEDRRLQVFRKRILWNGAMQFHVLYNDITKRKQAEEELQRTLESLRKAVSATTQLMISAVEIRDPYTGGHQIRSADLARAIATEMGLPKDRIDGIRMAGTIHDIGKLSVPAEILSKPTKLTELEFSLIKEHANKGFEMLKDVESPWPLAQIVYQHHERMDGSGYPRHLKGDEILMEARILAVADVVESMASHRPYRPALGLNAALEELENNKGTLYDVDVADACLRLFREKGFQLEEIRF